MKRTAMLFAGTILAFGLGITAGCGGERGDAAAVRTSAGVHHDVTNADLELARLLVRLEKQTRAVVAGHYLDADDAHRDWMAAKVLLPAAVADKVFSEQVPKATSDRAWVRMVVDSPRNPNNQGDATALALLAELRDGGSVAQRVGPTACYYAEPIVAAGSCLRCHGDPAGQPDPYFPQYQMNGWKEGDVVGAVVARVAPAT